MEGLYPIIRRKRRPLILVELPVEVIPVPPEGTKTTEGTKVLPAVEGAVEGKAALQLPQDKPVSPRRRRGKAGEAVPQPEVKSPTSAVESAESKVPENETTLL